MRHKHVGLLIVVETKGDRHVPIGVVTNRDIALQVITREVEPRSVVVGDVMTSVYRFLPKNPMMWRML